MKWIKYQIVQSTVGEEIILANKKVGYSNENLAIAQKEAYNGYEIIDDSQSFEKEPLGIEVGGTGAKDAATARQKLGITPKNIGALSTSGGEVAGTVAFYNPEMSIRCAEIKNGTFRFRQTNPTDAWTPSLQLRKSDDSAILGAYGFYKGNGDTLDYYYIGNTSVSPLFKMTPNGTISLASALPVASGGHGATTPEQARQNLGIIPENIGAVKDSEYYGPIKKEGPICQAKCYEGTGIHVVTEFSPKQAGSGDPYPAGGGKNLMPPRGESITANGITITANADGSVTYNGTATATLYHRVSDYFKLAAGEYILSGCAQGSSSTTYFMRFVDNNQAAIGHDYGAGYRATFTTESDILQVHVVIANGLTVSNLTFYPMIRLASDPDATYAPYSNIRPITGYDAMELNHAGKNLAEIVCPIDGVVTENADGTITVTNNASGEISGAKCELTGMLPPGTYTISKYDTKGSVYLQTRSSDYSNDITTYTFDYDGASYLRIVCSNIKAGESVTYKIQLERGSTSTPYEPYQGNTCTVQIGQTVYGGKMDWLTGKLVAEWAMKTLDGTEAQLHIHDGWSDGTLDVHEFFNDAVSVDGYVAKANIICSHLPAATPADMANGRANIGVGQGQTNVLFARIGKEYNTVELIRAYLAAQKDAGTPVQVVYKLAAPVEIQLDKIGAIEALNGINTIYSNADNCIVEFGHAPELDVIYSTEEPTYQAGAIWLKPID